MNDTMSKNRERAEVAFGKVQSQFLARTRAVEDVNDVVTARDEKTARLRELRLAKEASQPVAEPAKRRRRSPAT